MNYPIATKNIKEEKSEDTTRFTVAEQIATIKIESKFEDIKMVLTRISYYYKSSYFHI